MTRVAAVLSQGASEATGQEPREALEEKRKPPQTHLTEPSRSERVLCVVPLNNIQRSHISQWLAPRSQESWVPRPALPVTLLFWLCLGHRTSVFLFPCYYSMWQRGGTPSMRHLPSLRRAAKDQLSSAPASEDRESIAPVSRREAACKSAWSTDPQELNPQGNSQPCPSVSFQPPRSALHRAAKGRGSGTWLRSAPECHITDASQTSKQRLSPTSISAAYPSARALLQPGGTPDLRRGLSPCCPPSTAHAFPRPPTPARFSSRRGENLPPLSERRGFREASDQFSAIPSQG